MDGRDNRGHDACRYEEVLRYNHFSRKRSFVPKDGSDQPPSAGGRNVERNFRGEKRSNDTHSSTTDPDSRLFRKGIGKQAKLCYMRHLMTENRNGLIVDARATEAKWYC